MNVPDQCAAAECPMAGIAKNFALPTGQLPPRSGICLLLEAAGADEGVFLIKELVDGYAEMQRRRERYKGLDEKWITKGAPVVGRSGFLMWSWILAPLGIQRSDVAVFNCLSCFPGKDGTGGFFYPKGNVRKRAEAQCASLWLQGLVDWNPTISIVAMHPSAISRDVTPLPVVLRAVERAKVFAAKGERVLLLMGGKAAKHWMGYGENTTRWCNHWQIETPWTRQRRQERWDENGRLSVVKVKREKKLTAKTALLWLLSASKEVNSMNTLNSEGTIWKQWIDVSLTQEKYDEILALCETKKKVKGEVAVCAG